jgi:hypothetical protein
MTSEGIPSSQLRQNVLFGAFLILLVAIIYYNALFGTFIWDDRAAVVRRGYQSFFRYLLIWCALLGCE